MLTESSPDTREAHTCTHRDTVPVLVARTVIRAYSSHLTCVHCEPTRSVHISLLYGVFREIYINAFASGSLAEFACNSRSVKLTSFLLASIFIGDLFLIESLYLILILYFREIVQARFMFKLI